MLDEAREIVEKVRGSTNVDADFEDLRDAGESARAMKNPFQNLPKPRNWPQLIIGALGIPAIQLLSAMNSILFYAPVIFQSLGFGSGAALYCSLITSSMLVPGALVSMGTVDRLGRRFLFIEAGIQMICSMVSKYNNLNVIKSMQIVLTFLHIKLLVVHSGYGCCHIGSLKFGTGEEISKGLAACCCYMCLRPGLQMVMGTTRLVGAKLVLPLETCSASQSVVVCVNMFFTAAVAECFLAALCHRESSSSLLVSLSSCNFLLSYSCLRQSSSQ
jgi:MFS transporter, SP family, sugar:H+ symporter